MNALDYVLIGLLVAFLLYGYFKGFARQILLLIAVGASFFLATKFHPDVASLGFMEEMRSKNENTALVVAFVGILFLAAAALSFVLSLITRRMEHKELSQSNRWLGALLSLGVGVILLGGLAVGLREWQTEEGAVGSKIEVVKEKTQGWVDGSRLVPFLSDACLGLVDNVAKLIPQAGRDELARMYEENLKGFGKKSDDDASGLVNSLTTTTNDASGEPVPASGLLDLGARRQLTQKLEEAATPVSATSEAITEETQEGSATVPATSELEKAADDAKSAIEKAAEDVKESGEEVIKSAGEAIKTIGESK